MTEAPQIIEPKTVLKWQNYVCTQTVRIDNRLAVAVVETLAPDPKLRGAKPEERKVATVFKTERGLWKATLRGQEYAGRSLRRTLQALCMSDQKARATVGLRGADTLKMLMGLYDDPVRNLEANIALMVVNRVLRRPATTYSPHTVADLTALNPSAQVWATYFASRKRAKFEGVKADELSGLQVADALGLMTDEGITTNEKADAWLDAHRRSPVSIRGAEVQPVLSAVAG